MPQVDVGMGGEEGCVGTRGCKESTLGSDWAEPWVEGAGATLPPPRWLVLSCLRELSSWLLW